MSGRLVSAVFDSALPAWLKPYAAACATFAADDGTRVFPTVGTLARMLSKSERSTQRALNALRARGILVVETAATRYRPTRYRLHVAALPHPSDPLQILLFPQAALAQTGAKTTKAASFAQFPQGYTGRGDVGVTPGVTWVSPDPSGDPSRANQRTTRARAENLTARKARTA
jgi:hypothetical protein